MLARFDATCPSADADGPSPSYVCRVLRWQMARDYANFAIKVALQRRGAVEHIDFSSQAITFLGP